MKILKFILIALVVIIGVYSAWMVSLPSSYTMEKTAVIDAEPSKVYQTVTNLQSWEHWSYWHKVDTTNVTSYAGNPNTIGSSYTWKGEQIGEGTFTMTNLEENKKMEYSLFFVGMNETDGYFLFDEVEEGKTKVTYAMNAKFGFFDRIAKYFIDYQIGEAFQTSLMDLKTYVENLPEEKKNTFQFSIMTNEPVEYIGIKDELSFEEMTTDYFDQRYQEIVAFAGEDSNNMHGAPFAIYEKWDMENKMVRLVVAMPIKTEKAANERIIKGTTHVGDVLKTTYFGPYEKSGEAHWAVDTYVKENNLKVTGYPWEVYVVNPEMETDPMKLVTEIYYPISTVVKAE